MTYTELFICIPSYTYIILIVCNLFNTSFPLFPFIHSYKECYNHEHWSQFRDSLQEFLNWVSIASMVRIQRETLNLERRKKTDICENEDLTEIQHFSYRQRQQSSRINSLCDLINRNHGYFTILFHVLLVYLLDIVYSSILWNCSCYQTTHYTII